MKEGCCHFLSSSVFSKCSVVRYRLLKWSNAMKNLIFIEGVSGVGKSTTTTKLCKKLPESGYTAVCHLEGEIKSPVDLFWVAF